MKKILIPLFAASALGFLGIGCKTETGAYPPVNTTRFDLENREKFVLLNEGAQNSITSSGIQEKYLSDGRLQVTANVRNRENRRIQVQINCVFKDEQGFAVDETPYRTLILDENAQESVPFVAANTQAKKYTIRVREAR
jgi:uncharacterized protein YcfL